jgi:hypothetical protein
MRMPAVGRARLFFQEHIVPTMREWEASPLEPHRAMSLAVNLNQMADYYWAEFGADPARVLGAKDLRDFRNKLSTILPAFGLVRDVADAHKHFELSRPNRRITDASQATLGALRFDEVPWDEGKWDSLPEIVVTFDDGTKHPFDISVRRVRDKWQDMLRSAGAV